MQHAFLTSARRILFASITVVTLLMVINGQQVNQSSRDGVISIIARLRSGRFWFRISAVAWGFSLLQNFQKRCGVHLAFYSGGTGVFPQGWSGRERESDHSTPSGAEVKNEWSYKSAFSYFWTAWTGTSLRLPL
jgi:hypothetical protein